MSGDLFDYAHRKRQEQTSLAAYAAIFPRLSERRRAVLAFMVERGRDVTALEAARGLDLPRSSVGPRFAELRERDLVESVATRTCEVSGETAKTWRLTGRPMREPDPQKRPSWKAHALELREVLGAICDELLVECWRHKGGRTATLSASADLFKIHDLRERAVELLAPHRKEAAGAAERRDDLE